MLLTRVRHLSLIWLNWEAHHWCPNLDVIRVIASVINRQSFDHFFCLDFHPILFALVLLILRLTEAWLLITVLISVRILRERLLSSIKRLRAFAFLLN